MEQIDRSGLKNNACEIAEVTISNGAFSFAFYIKIPFFSRATPFWADDYTLLGR